MSTVRSLARAKTRRPASAPPITGNLTTFYEQLALKDLRRKQRLQRILNDLDRKQGDRHVADLDGNRWDPQHVAEIVQLRPQWVSKMFVVRRRGQPPQIVVGELRHAPLDGVFAIDSGDIGKARDLETFLYVYLGHFPNYAPSDVRRDEPKRRNKRA